MSGQRTWIIAEAGVNHNGSLELAFQLVDRAADAGADAVKFQTFTADRLVSRSAQKAPYQKRTTAADESQYDMIRRLELDEPAHRQLINRCRAHGIEFLSSPFDEASVQLLTEKLAVSRLKVPSGEITNAPLLLQIARSGRPVILSTGMATLGDIEDALGVLAFGYVGGKVPNLAAFRTAYRSPEGRSVLARKVTLLHCTTEYPAPPEEVNLRVMETLRTAFSLPVGYSDHTEGITVPIAAVACGATVIEKHFTLDRNLPGPDHRASAEPDEFRLMVEAIRRTERVLGASWKGPTASESRNLPIARKSLVAARPIARGERLTVDNLTTKRPGTGVSPLLYWDYLGRNAEADFAEDDPIR